MLFNLLNFDLFFLHFFILDLNHIKIPLLFYFSININLDKNVRKLILLKNILGCLPSSGLFHMPTGVARKRG